MGTSRIDFDAVHAARRVRIHLDSANVPGWNEIDTAALVDVSGQVHWAVDAPRAVNREVRAVHGCGWPMRALRWHYELPATGAPFAVRGGIVLSAPPGALPEALPLLPIWPGLLVDTLAWAAVATALVRLLRLPVRVVRRSLRLYHGRCPECGYDLRYDLAKGSPECSWRRVPATPTRPGAPAGP